MLALQQIQISKSSRLPLNLAFYDYYMKKVSEGKSKTQALVALMRLLVKIIYRMMKYKTEYQLLNVQNTMVS